PTNGIWIVSQTALYLGAGFILAALAVIFWVTRFLGTAARFRVLMVALAVEVVALLAAPATPVGLLTWPAVVLVAGLLVWHVAAAARNMRPVGPVSPSTVTAATVILVPMLAVAARAQSPAPEPVPVWVVPGTGPDGVDERVFAPTEMLRRLE